MRIWRKILFSEDRVNEKIIEKIQQIFKGTPEVIYGYTDIHYSVLSREYKSALVFAVPYEKQLTLDNYTEEGFHKCPENCKKCVDVCPHKVLTDVKWNIKELRSNLIDYHLCNQKRSAYIEKYGRKSACGLCIVVCPFGTESN